MPKSLMKKWWLMLAVLAAAVLLSGAAACAKPSGDTGNLHVLVQGTGAGPLSGVKVVSNSQPDGQLKVTGLTGSDGTVTFNGIKVGQYEFYVNGAGYQQQDFGVVVSPGATRNVTITMERSSG